MWCVLILVFKKLFCSETAVIIVNALPWTQLMLHSKRKFYESALNDHENAFRNITKTHKKVYENAPKKSTKMHQFENRRQPNSIHRSSHIIIQRTSDEEISDSACSEKIVRITLDGRSHAVSVAFLLQAVRKICTASFCTVSSSAW